MARPRGPGSFLTRFLIVLLLAAGAFLLLSVLYPSTVSADQGTGDGIGQPSFATYKVKAGDSLVGIAMRELGDPGKARDIYALNPEISHPDRIRVNQELRLPVPTSDPAQNPWVDESTFASIYNTIAGWGLLEVGIALVIAGFLAVQMGTHLLIGSLFLWAGASLAKVEEAGFGRCLWANFKGVLYMIVAGVATWGVVTAAFAIIGREAVFSVPFSTLVLITLGVLVTAQVIELTAYFVAIKGALRTTVVRAGMACVLMVMLQCVLSVAMAPVLGTAALGL